MTVSEILEQIKTLSPQEGKALAKLLIDMMDMPEAVPAGEPEPIQPLLSPNDTLAGLVWMWAVSAFCITIGAKLMSRPCVWLALGG